MLRPNRQPLRIEEEALGWPPKIQMDLIRHWLPVLPDRGGRRVATRHDIGSGAVPTRASRSYFRVYSRETQRGSTNVRIHRSESILIEQFGIAHSIRAQPEEMVVLVCE
jgi:hypothetical protein